MDSLRIVRLPIVFIIFAISGCASLGGGSESNDPYRPYDIYYGGQKVGTAVYESILIPGSVGRTYRDFIIEEITYSGSRYRFEFVIEGELDHIKIIRYERNTDRAILGNSYRLRIENNAVVRTYIQEDGETFANTRVIQNRATVEHVEQMFQLCRTMIEAHYLSRSIRERRNNTMPSLGYQLLVQDRL